MSRNPRREEFQTSDVSVDSQSYFESRKDLRLAIFREMQKKSPPIIDARILSLQFHFFLGFHINKQNKLIHLRYTLVSESLIPEYSIYKFQQAPTWIVFLGVVQYRIVESSVMHFPFKTVLH